ncbi:polysaccharide deacetylase family protein [Noviherbaspirillum saxi]|uniref:NodB homology domain-containing protein n=1 Tax=Noviherbaspirillum saxi TaxID=2320863 RepID=A0A3A3FGX2_9BURK|nr:polysaccharide deacetylase family protein [Noviherbaspirillum saxi]RJF92420.1 hypothetical protein D3871_27780 [Noviherbaspirillum saxi]
MSLVRLMRTLLGMVCVVVAMAGGKVHASDLGSLRSVYLYSSPATGAFFKANDSDYNNLLGYWRLYLKKFGKDFREVNRSELIANLSPGVLVLGSALLLDDEERRAIDAFTRRGGSVLATWGTGARDGLGKWRGYGFLSDMFEVKVAGEVSRDQEAWFLMPFGDGPVTWPLPAGRRMYLGKTAENMLRIDARQLAARYMDWNRAPDFAQANGAIAYSELHGARRLYIGFSEASWDYHTRDDITQMLDAMLAWLMREPRIFKAAWPDGKTATQLLEMDTEALFENGVHFAKQLDDSNIRGTFYSLTSEAIKNPELVRSLLRRGHEIAYHADIHIGFQNQKPEQQEQRILNMLDQMRKIVGPNLAPHTGFRAPTESYDKTTEILLRKHGMKHHAADPSSTEDRLPFFSKSEKNLSTEEALVVLPRTNSDDITFRMAGMNNEKVTKNLLQDFEHVVEMGAFGLLSVHSQNYGPDGPMTLTMPTLFKRIAELRNRLWLPRADEVAAWWRARERVTWRADHEGGQHVINFAVRPPGMVKGLSFIVTHPRAGMLPMHVEAMSPYAPAAEIRPIDAFRSAIVFSNAHTGSYQYRVLF